ncbi:Transposase-like protein [Mycena venus]|uniref:Transposase-like protein n=1 Tax=Mycena venus TaxID=2733690 RepID=A0A8H6Z9Z2_9AGAR|nr:Transposase-like protein [Mycena venus]
MLRRALQFRGAIFNYVAKDEELRAHELSTRDWTALKLVTNWLVAFREATTQILQSHLKTEISKLPADADPVLRQGLVDAHLKLSNYFAKFEQSRYYTWATSLDPRISYNGLKIDYADDQELLIDLDLAKAALQTHFDVVYGSRTTVDEPIPNDSIPGSPKKIDFTSRYSKLAVAATTNELVDYFRLTAVPESWNVDPLHWWYSRRKQFPNLYLLVRNVLCIPRSAVAVERIFSGGRDTIGLRRACLKAETSQTLMFVKARLRVARAALKKEMGDDF